MTIHMQEAELRTDLDRVLAHIRAGDEICLELDGQPTATILPSQTRRADAPAKDILAILRSYELERGPLVMDDDFADDLEEAHRIWNQPLDTTEWD